MYCDIQSELRKTLSNKTTTHQYGFFYDMLFNYLASKQGRKIDVLELGVSEWVPSSLDAWANSDIVNIAVGVDIAGYNYDNRENKRFYKMNAYTKKAIDFLENKGYKFDIIIEDGPSGEKHGPKCQAFFLNNYHTLLKDGGVLVCEDVHDIDLVIDQCQNHGAICFDGWANQRNLPYDSEKNTKLLKKDKVLRKGEYLFDWHQERILIKSKEGFGYRDVDVTETKPHIPRLPVIPIKEYRRDNTELAISVPLFYSEIDSHFEKFNEKRFQNVHAKGAIWAGLSMLHNTDLIANGVPLYFHIEDKVWDIVKPVFDDFQVPEDWIKIIEDVPTDELPKKLKKAQFGKKHIPFLDDTIDPDILMILDSDAFVIAERPCAIYEDLTCSLLKTQPSMTFCEIGRKQYGWYISVMLLSAGLCPSLLDSGKSMNELEQLAHKHLGFDMPLGRDYKRTDIVPRFFVENYMSTFPRNHPVRAYAIEHIGKCHCAPYLFSIWNQYNQGFVQLDNIIALPVYDFVDEFMEGKKGYNCLMHVRTDNHEDIDRYWDVFIDLLTTSINK